jgi:DNA repair exonuclease SbcCD ATPase subunit
MDLYKQYQADYLDLVSEIKDKIQNAVELAGDDKRYAVREAENAYKEAEQLLDSMELSARTIPGKFEELSAQVKNYKSDLKNLRKDLQNLSDKSDRMSLLGGTDRDISTSLDQRNQMRSLTQQLDSQGDDIRNSHSVALGALESGTSTLRTLGEQRERIESQRRNVKGINEQLDTAKKIMNRIWATFVKNKLLQILLIVVLVIIITVIIYLKFIYTEDPYEPVPIPSNSTTPMSTPGYQPQAEATPTNPPVF